MSHEDDEAVIILSVAVPPEVAECLDRKAEHGPFGDTREEVAQFYLCHSFGVPRPAKHLPEQAAPVDGPETIPDPALDEPGGEQ